jgi:carbon monoxide dehydrogenase subunit G
MLISGEIKLPAPVDTVWRALHDVDVLRATVPGCQELTQTSPDTFTGAATVGIAVIKGLYKGTLQLLEQREPVFARIAVQAKSGHAEIRGEGELSLAAADGETMLRYSGEALISGPLAAVGQRLLPSASKSLTEQFFRNVEQHLLRTAAAQSKATS